MLLSDRDLKAAIGQGRMGLSPYDEAMVQPSSIDVRLDRYFRVFANHRYTHIDPAVAQEDLTEQVEPDGDEAFILHPGEFVLGSTVEVITLGDDLAARLEGKSSLGRLGLLTHSTAGFIDPGFSGHVTLELSNVANLPIKLYPGMKIGQVCVLRLSSPAEHPYGSSVYGSRYQDQRGPTPSRSAGDGEALAAQRRGTPVLSDGEHRQPVAARRPPRLELPRRPAAVQQAWPDQQLRRGRRRWRGAVQREHHGGAGGPDGRVAHDAVLRRLQGRHRVRRRSAAGGQRRPLLARAPVDGGTYHDHGGEGRQYGPGS